MGTTWALIHLSDTHFASQREALSVPLLMLRPLPVGGFLGAIFSTTRRWVVMQHGAQAAEPALVISLHSALAKASAILQAAMSSDELDGGAVVHTGDLTQAGQIGSMQEELDNLLANGGLPFYGQIGNHDMWPAEFPPFAPHRIALQQQWVRGLQPPSGGTTLPARYPAFDLLGSTGEIELVRFNTVLGDALPNAIAWGAVADEHDPSVPAGVSESQFAGVQARTGSTRLRVAMMHHPPFSLHKGSIWAAASNVLVSPTWCGLIESAHVQNELLRLGVNLVLCGHEHKRSAHQIFKNGQILQLATGSPAFRKGRGNHDPPHFSLHWIDIVDDAIYIWWCVCVITSLGHPTWSVEAVFRLDQATGVWSAINVPADYPVPLQQLITGP